MLRAKLVYPDKEGKTPSSSTSTRSERRGSRLFKRQIEAVKNGVRIEQEARARGDFKPLGNDRLLGHCVSPTHTDRTASMTVYTDAQTFKCYGLGCGAQRDVLDLVMLAEPEMEFWEAMVYLSTRYGIKLPESPKS
jgi:DNA primase